MLIWKPAVPVESGNLEFRVIPLNESGNPEFLVIPGNGIQYDCRNQIREPGFAGDSGIADFQMTPGTRSSGFLLNPDFRVFPGNESRNPKFRVAPGTGFRVLGVTRNSGG